MQEPLDALPPEQRRQLLRLLADGALLAISHSGGKDSQAATLLIHHLAPPGNVVVFHAPLEHVEWHGTIAHIRNTLPAGTPLILASIASGKTLLERVRERGRFPDKSRRWCTSDFKRGPIEREIRRYLHRTPRHRGQVIQCLGLRADESTDRAKRLPWTFSGRNSAAGRRWYDWLPILHLHEEEVFETIRAAGQRPHWVYAKGMRRCSCSFCIFATDEDHATAARLRPDLLREYDQVERETGHTLSPSRRFLTDIVASTRPRDPANPHARKPATGLPARHTPKRP